MKRACLSVPLVVVLVSTAQADIIGVTAGATYPPPGTLGPYEMTAFGPDDRPVLEWVTFVPSPLGGEAVFSAPMLHRRLGESGAQWSLHLPPDYYSAQSSPSEITLGLPPQTRAFYLYAGHDLGSPRYITATADDGTSIGQWVEHTQQPGYFGFYVDDPAETVSSITVTVDTNLNLGAFGVAIPEPSSLLLLSAALLAVPRRRPAR